ncbi:hypothetical protein NOR_00665 [Metarhizium rileyi]|uniref:Uncharacterized protein n=1 Tax=Metarhizium rileyi (strain RCEF 4871) TaxID=1649241 RepID=A0A167KR27_METRR|nr:hypothetical protein NOR_00665 [Metarhizium rileyi RCEF 4871]
MDIELVVDLGHMAQGRQEAEEEIKVSHRSSTLSKVQMSAARGLWLQPRFNPPPQDKPDIAKRKRRPTASTRLQVWSRCSMCQGLLPTSISAWAESSRAWQLELPT